MSRIARITVPGFPHHITARGNRRAAVFETDEDRTAYLRFLETYCARHGLAVWAYCLMTNHIHLVAVPATEQSLSLALRDTHTVYSLRFNARTQLSGHVWQGRFYSCPMDEDHLWTAVRYVELNPVRAGLAARAEDYPWSSAAAHCGLRRDPALSGEFPPQGVIEDWSSWLAAGDNETSVRALRTHTHTGRPCGTSGFVAMLEGLLDRTLGPKKRGPRPKAPSLPDAGAAKKKGKERHGPT